MTAPSAAPAPTGLKAKASAVGLKVYLASPPKAQTAMLNGFMKAQPVVAKARPHGQKILAGTGTLLVLRKLKNRRK
ncbi:MAG: hypothetical protein JWO12_249 [Frankiales bacterium]|jgi:hypothetical protein|nr:hypothetical protein [Frankiales bacterium]